MDVNITLESLKQDFEARLQRSMNKEDLLKREIAFFGLIYSFKPINLYTGTGQYTSGDISIDNKFPEYVDFFDNKDIFLIRKVYAYFIINGRDISEAEKWYQEYIKYLKESNTTLHAKGESFVNAVLLYYQYYQWLKSISTTIEKTKSGYPEKYYAWYHMILIQLGKEHNFPNNFRKTDIIKFGKNRYNTGEGFYKAFKIKELNKTTSFVSKMSARDRGRWKDAIIDISSNDADIIRYLKECPN